MKENDIALISPPAKWMHKEIPYPPLGIAYLSAVGNSIGIKTSIVDAQFPEYSSRLDEVVGKEPQLIGISSTLMQLPEAIDIAHDIKESNPNSIIAFGGPGPNCLDSSEFFSLAGESVDLVCQGEGEETWKEIITRFAGSVNKDGEIYKPHYMLEGVSGTIIQHNGDVVVNPPRRQIQDLDTIPMPDLKGIEADRYIELWRQNGGMGSISIFPSRGCPFGCVFCDKTIFGKMFRNHSPERIVDEMERVVEDHGPIDDIFLFDDNLSTNREVMLGLCDEISKRSLRVNWSCQARVSTVDPEMLKAMSNAGCKEIYYGVEAVTQPLLDYLGKGISPEQAIDAIRMSREAGIKPGCFLMVGIPGETEGDIDEIEKFILESKPAYVGFSVLTPFPGTELFNRTKSLIKPEMVGRYGLWDDTRSSIYKDDVFEVNPQQSIERIERFFKNFLEKHNIDFNPSQFTIERYD